MSIVAKQLTVDIVSQDYGCLMDVWIAISGLAAMNKYPTCFPGTKRVFIWKVVHMKLESMMEVRCLSKHELFLLAIARTCHERGMDDAKKKILKILGKRYTCVAKCGRAFETLIKDRGLSFREEKGTQQARKEAKESIRSNLLWMNKQIEIMKRETIVAAVSSPKDNKPKFVKVDISKVFEFTINLNN